MKKIILFILIITVPFKIFSATTKIKMYTGDVKVKQGAYASWKSPSSNMILRRGDQIKTGARSFAIVDVGGDQIRVAQNSFLEISSDMIDDKQTGTISLFVGRLTLKLNKLKRRKDGYGVNTPSTVAAVRGTNFDIATAQDGKTTIQVIEGSVAVKGVSKEVLVAANQETSVEIGKDPEKVRVMRKKDWEKWLEDGKKNAKKNEKAILNGCLQKMRILEKEIELLEKGAQANEKIRLDNLKKSNQYQSAGDEENAKKYKKIMLSAKFKVLSMTLKAQYKSSRMKLVKNLADSIYNNSKKKTSLKNTYIKIDNIYKKYYVKYIKSIEESQERRRKYEENKKNNNSADSGKSCIM